MISPTKKPIYVALCVIPNSITCISLLFLFFEMVIFMIHVNIWFILHRSAVIISKLVKKHGRGEQLKNVVDILDRYVVKSK